MTAWTEAPAARTVDAALPEGIGRRPLYPSGKRLFDIALGLAALPVLALVMLVLAVLNPALNPGPVLFRQERMGRGCRPFTVLKLRTMRPSARKRGPEDPLETDRIPPLGRLLRRIRLDELPQVVNMLRGEMSFVGPRPDCMIHARAFLRSVPGYGARHAVRPGLTGRAQVRLGYAVGARATRAKVREDLRYVAEAGWGADLRIVAETVGVILAGRGR